MKNIQKLEAWLQSDEGKKSFAQISSEFKELTVLVPDGKTFTDFIKDQEPKIKNICIEIATLIDTELKIKPDPESVYNFLLDEVDLRSCLPKLDLDKLIILYAEERAKKVKSKINESSIYHSMFNDLINAKYINTSLDIFSYVMQYKKIPGGAEKIQWLTSQADAIYFQENFFFSFPEFNECFISKTGTKFQLGSKSGTARKKDLINIVELYK